MEETKYRGISIPTGLLRRVKAITDNNKDDFRSPSEFCVFAIRNAVDFYESKQHYQTHK